MNDAPRCESPLVMRPRLFARLSGAMSTARITALIAPAGYGKSTLLTQWFAHPSSNGRRVATVSLHPRDNELRRFVRGLARALSELGADDRTTASILAIARDEVRGGAQEAPETLLLALHEALEDIPHKALLVMENLHALRQANVLGVLEFLADVLPPPVRLVLTSRNRVPLREAAAARARGELREIGVAELMFTPEESRVYLARHAPSLTENQGRELAERCEGWVAGLYLVTQALAARSDPGAFLREFTGHTGDIADFLLHEVLDHQEPAIRDFLLDIGVLDLLSAEACRVVSRRPDSGRLLSEFHREGGFVVGLDDGQHYRLHPLFAEFLRGELNRVDPDRARALHQRAARWLAGIGKQTAAFEHAISALDHELAAQVLEQVLTQDLSHHLDPDVAPLFAQLPRPVIERRPLLATRMIYLALWADQPAEALLWCEHVAQLPDSVPGRADALCMQVFAYWMLGDLEQAMTRAKAAQAFLSEREHARGQHSVYPRLAMMEALSEIYECSGHYDDAMEVILDGLVRARGGVHPLVAVAFPGKRAALLSRLGHFEDVEEYAQLSLATAANTGLSDQPPTLEAKVALGEMLCERNELRAAEEQLRAAVRIGAVADRVWMRARAMAALARVLAAGGQVGEGVAVLREAMSIDPRGALPHFVRVYLLEQQVWLRLVHGDPAGARGWHAELTRHAQDEEACGELLAWLELETSPDRALSAARGMLASPGRQRPAQAQLRLHLLAARAADGARLEGHHLAAATEIAARSMLVRTFLEAAAHQGCAAALHGMVGQELDPFRDALQQALHGEAVVTSPKSRTAGVSPGPLIDPLTPAERDLVPLLATENTYAEIAAARHVSVNTVKTQMQAVYRKLGVSSRIAAIQRARTLGL